MEVSGRVSHAPYNSLEDANAARREAHPTHRRPGNVTQYTKLPLSRRTSLAYTELRSFGGGSAALGASVRFVSDADLAAGGFLGCGLEIRISKLPEHD